MSRANDKDDGRWRWFSDDVLAARADLKDALSPFMYHRDEEAMRIIHKAAELIETRLGPEEARNACAAIAEQWIKRGSPDITLLPTALRTMSVYKSADGAR